jgi:hypothetical protein
VLRPIRCAEIAVKVGDNEHLPDRSINLLHE